MISSYNESYAEVIEKELPGIQGLRTLEQVAAKSSASCFFFDGKGGLPLWSTVRDICTSCEYWRTSTGTCSSCQGLARDVLAHDRFSNGNCEHGLCMDAVSISCGSQRIGCLLSVSKPADGVPIPGDLQSSVGSLLTQLAAQSVEEHLNHALEHQIEDAVYGLILHLAEATDYRTAFAQCVRIACRVAGMDSGGIYLRDSETGDFTLQYCEGLSEDFQAAAFRGPRDSKAGDLVNKGDALYMNFQDLPIEHNEIMLAEGLQSCAVVPLKHAGQVIGCFNLASHSVQQISVQSRMGVEKVAAQLAGIVAILKAEQEVRERETRLSVLFEEAPVAYAMADKFGRIMAVNKQAVKLTGFSRSELIGRFLEDVQWITGVRTKFSVKPGTDKGPLEGALKRADGTEIPIVIYHYQTTIEGRSVHLTAVLDMSHEKAAKEKIMRQHDQLRLLARELSVAEKRERKRLAQKLHDDLQQLIVAARLTTEAAAVDIDSDRKKRLERAIELMDEAVKVSREMAVELSPPVLHTQGFVPALHWLVADMMRKYELQVQLHVDTTVHLNEDVRVFLFHAIRELLFNVVKHAGTKESCVTVCEDQIELTILVKDSGRGFHPEVVGKATPNGEGFGLFSIRERLRAFGGRMEIASAPGQGALFTLKLPGNQSSR